MPLGTPLKSMFLRRLSLILALVAFGMVMLTGQLFRLTVVQGATLREEAEAKLVTRDWLPTSRGRVLDRKGRVLAQDRPAFDVAVDFRVLGGDWAIGQAGALARAEAGVAAWRELDPEERRARIDAYVPVFQEHLERMWAELGRAAGVSEGTLLTTRVAIEQRVVAMQRYLSGQRIGRELRQRLARGEEITPEVEEDLVRRHSRPINEQKSPHVVLAGVADPVGFELRRMAGVKVDLPVMMADGSERAVSVPLLPGVTVVDSGQREYPFERVEVEVDLSTLPGPLGVGAGGGGTVRVICEGVAYHILGRMKERAQAEDNRRRREKMEADEAFKERVLTPEGLALAKPLDRGEYTEHDAAGLSGVEASQEDELRGLRGLIVQRRDTGREERVEATAGRDVHLTIDISLQARVQAAMSREVGLAVAAPWQRGEHLENVTVPDGTWLSGAAVVLEVDSGDILAMVSSPTIPRRVLAEHAEAFFRNPLNEKVEMPWIDRSIARPYPPGSIVKALILASAVTRGEHALDSPITCEGHLFPGKPDQFRCWIFKQFDGRMHGPLMAPEALMVSCNIYFFTLGQRLGPKGIVEAYRSFGVGEAWNLGVGAEFKGTIGSYLRTAGGALSRDDAGNLLTAPPSLSDATQMGIGQGPVAWTPLHAAASYATLARGGFRVRPRLIDDGSMPETAELRLDVRAVKEAMEGLGKSVNEPRGTGHHIRFADGTDVPHFNAEGVQVWGKTGTAEAPTISVKPGEPLYEQGVIDPALPAGVRALRRGDHSWFVVLAGKKGENRPKYAIAVMMEYAGSGGKVSGPIVNQIIHALKREGYL
ncbi:MAG: penicillin-binding transpeptidase domain-containing protein [Phycisphaerales bacterium]